MQTVEAFSTIGVPPRRRLEYWNRLASETFTPQIVEARNRADFNGRLIRRSIDQLAVAEVSSDPAVFHHSKSHAAGARPHQFFIELQLEGRSVIKQDGREAALEPGDFTICDTTRPYEVKFDLPVSVLVLAPSVTDLRRFIGFPETVTAYRMAGRSGMSGVTSKFIRNLWEELKAAREGVVESHAAEATLNLVACAYSSVQQACPEGGSLSTVRRMVLLRQIEQSLTDPELTPGKVAEKCRISKRYVHRLFLGQGETLREYILRRRLEICRQMLSNPAQRSRSITAISVDAGFNSVSQFCTTFRERYGMTPGEYRNDQRPCPGNSAHTSSPAAQVLGGEDARARTRN
jgi:AraC-like DNA-binding protein